MEKKEETKKKKKSFYCQRKRNTFLCTKIESSEPKYNDEYGSHLRDSVSERWFIYMSELSVDVETGRERGRQRDDE